MWGLSTSGEEGVVIGARRTETKKNSLEFPASKYASYRRGCPDQTEIERCLPSAVLNTWEDWGLQASGTGFFPSPPSSIYKCLLHLSMSGAHIFPGAHDFVVSGTINSARIVREAVWFS